MVDLIRFLADGLLLLIVVAATLAAVKGFRWGSFAKSAPYVVMAGLSSLLFGKLMSLIVQPDSERPFIRQGVEAGAAFIDNPGFPSDHMLLAVVIVVAVWYMTPYKKIALVLGVMAIAMGAARVAALVHTPLDVFGGLLAGAVGILWYRRGYMLKDLP